MTKTGASRMHGSWQGLSSRFRESKAIAAINLVRESPHKILRVLGLNPKQPPSTAEKIAWRLRPFLAWSDDHMAPNIGFCAEALRRETYPPADGLVPLSAFADETCLWKKASPHRHPWLEPRTGRPPSQ